MSRFCILFLLAGMLTVFAKDSYAQKVRISLEMSNTPLGKVINEIKNQTEFEFAYDSDLESITFKKVSIKASDENIEQVMNSVLAGTGVTYRVIDRIILLSKNEMITTASAARQGITIRGVVTDESGEPMPGVNVLVKGTTSGVVTGVDGRYSIGGLSNGNVLVFSFIGYAVQEVIVDGQQTVNITLVESSQEIEEVVVTALGIRREEKALGYAVQKVSGNTLQTVKGVDVGTSLTGKVSGLLVKNSSDFAQAPTIQVRGETPLIVIDGVPYANMKMSDLSPDDIDNINVLKGATASALYGSRGENGAIMITTKQGSSTRGISVSINSGTMFNAGFLAIPKVQSIYGRGVNGTYARNGDRVWGRLMDGTDIEQWNPKTKQLEMMPYLPIGKDNFKNFLKTGYITNNNISIVQQGQNGSFRATASWVETKGQYPNSMFDKYSFGIGGDMKFDKFTLSSNLAYTKHHSPNGGFNGYTNYDPMYTLLIWTGTDYDVRDYRDYWLVKDELQNNSYTNASSLDNPYFQQYERTRSIDRDVFNGNITMNYEFTPWLKATLRSGLDSYIDRQDVKISKGNLTGSGADYGWSTKLMGHFATARYTGYSMNNDLIVSAEKSWGDFTVDAFAGGSIFFYKNESLLGSVNGGLSIPGYYSLKNSINKADVSSTVSEMQTNSLYGRLAVSWRRMIYAEGTLRNDWCSTLPESTRSYIYPSVSGSFIASELLPSTDWLSIWKLRGSWTLSKRPAAPYDINSTFAVTTNTWDGMTSSAVSGTIRGSDVRPQTSASYEIGTMINVFNNRASLDVAYYNKRTYDYLKTANLSQASGYNSQYINVDEEITRKGFEISASVTPVLTRDWKWDVNMNWSKYASYYTKLDETYSADKLWVKVDKRTDHYIGRDFLRDPEKNLIYTNGKLTNSAYDSVFGYTDPDWIWGVNTVLRYKNFTFGMSLDGRVGGVIPSVTETYMWISGVHPDSTTPERYKDVTDLGSKNYVGKGVIVSGGAATYDTYGNITSDTRTFAPNEVAVTYKEYVESAHRNYIWGGSPSPYDVYSGTFLKIREISFTYDLPREICAKFLSKGASVSVIGQNMFLWAEKFKYSDPDGGTENFSDPSQRYIGFNIKLNF